MRGGLFGILVVLLLIVGGVYALLATITSVTTANMTFFVLVSAITILTILIQKPKGGGLAGAFGGGGGGGGQQAMFGAKVGDALTWFTVVLFACFLTLAVALVFNTRADFQAGPITTGVNAPDAPDGAGAGEPQVQDAGDVDTIGDGKTPNPTGDTGAPAQTPEPAKTE